MLRAPFVLAALSLTCFLVPDQASAQVLSLGGRVSWRPELSVNPEEGGFGLGVQATVGSPLVGFRVQGTADLYFPDCGEEDCDFREVGLNVLFSPPIPVVAPYLGGGLAFLDFGGAFV